MSDVLVVSILVISVLIMAAYETYEDFKKYNLDGGEE